MQFSKNEIEQFKKLWLEEFSQVINDERATKEARRLLILIKFATDPVSKVEGIPDDENKKNINQNKNYGQKFRRWKN